MGKKNRRKKIIIEVRTAPLFRGWQRLIIIKTIASGFCHGYFHLGKKKKEKEKILINNKGTFLFRVTASINAIIKKALSK